ncbi:hypothetical protein [Malacoplasma iowae]|uniref:Uncharacterized protein n=1 Tax=Malacoplasma iowae DK-CPA TaxID=1394179 RepID=A0A084U450_MALIO|nr:hypothetical protein [Malacoplasma iowae]KFB07736.1 hypothetical protein P271_593 [Malacoplasma iowae DK-CPA]WPL37253.1 hypothetical protein QX179_02090 [Malacoplasma iowae]WPL40814.1 hypothetical protein QX184_04755 [Malacoplasma iowae]
MSEIKVNQSYDVTSLKPTFNKRVDIKRIYNFIEKKYSLNEVTQFGIVCYYKRKSNVVLITLTNEKIFIFSNRKDLEINGVYSYNDIEDFGFLEKKKKTYLNVTAKEKNFTLRNITKYDYDILCRVFQQQKEAFNNSKIGKNIISNFSTISSIDFFKKRNFYKDELIDEVQDNKDSENTNSESKIDNQTNNKKNKRVVNDKNISSDTTFSSLFIFELLSRHDKKMPGGNPTVLTDLSNRIVNLEKANPFDNPIDSVSFKLTSLSKLNTIPVIAEFSNIHDKSITENKLLFARNWIEYTKHNVKNKLLGVDSHGNGAYIDLSNYISKKIISYKAVEQNVDGIKRYGLRSGQKVKILESNKEIGLDKLYVNPTNGEGLDINKYDGLIFFGKKYYFNTLNEFSRIPRKYCRVIDHEWKTNGSINKTFEILFKDDFVTYKVYNDSGNVLNDVDKTSSNFDIKWLTLFKD